MLHVFLRKAGSNVQVLWLLLAEKEVTQLLSAQVFSLYWFHSGFNVISSLAGTRSVLVNLSMYTPRR